MRKILLTGVFALISLLGKAQFTQNDLIYYVGSGPDTAVMVIDFIDGTPDSAYAWGFLFDASATVTGGDMLAAVAADEDQLDFVTAMGFLSDITYNAHEGIGGMPNFWGTWSRTADTDWIANSGLPEVLNNGDWFGFSYTDFMPPLIPGEPIPAYESSRFSEADIQFWVGTGANTAVFVTDFVTSSFGEIATYAWGYRFDGTTDAGTMIADIDAADVNLNVDADMFLNDIEYNMLEGIGGMPGFWGTWSGTNLSDWTMNTGLGMTINDGDWFGVSYDEWPPRRPFYPIPAIDSADLVISTLDFLFGTGTNRAVVVIDFNEWLPGESFAFGYNFDEETISAEDVLIALNDYEPYGLDIDLTGGFLNDIIYALGFEGLGGMPNFWSTWSATNVGGWYANTGIGTEMSDGDWFGCSYTGFNPATPPSLSVNATAVESIDEQIANELAIYPNPASTFINVQFEGEAILKIVDLGGRVLLNETFAQGMNTVDVSRFDTGVYIVYATINGEISKQKLTIK